MKINYEKMPYFASESSGSMQFLDDIAAGYAKDGEPYYQLQQNDELGVYKECGGDQAAIRDCIVTALSGDPYALEQLRLAQTDGLVRRMQEELKVMFSPRLVLMEH